MRPTRNDSVLIVTDIDGTLLDHNGRLPCSAHEWRRAVHPFRALRGIVWVISVSSACWLSASFVFWLSASIVFWLGEQQRTARTRKSPKSPNRHR